MKLSSDSKDFVTKLDTIYPRLNDTLQLPFDQDLNKSLSRTKALPSA